jgi:uncharacterized protein YutE (UPF0331/DUF86 family)
MPLNVSHLKQRVKEILDETAELKRYASKPYAQLSMEEKYAIRYHVIVLAEALGSTCLLIAAEEFKLKPQSYTECFRVMEEKNLCKDCAKDLTAISRLRNLLSHRYWTIDDKQVYDSIKGDFRGVNKFIETVNEKYGINL